jgi:folate-binding protein YgfZ
MADPWSWSAAAPAPPLRLEQPVALMRLEGPDTLRFLHGQSSQDLALAQPGAWRRTCFITPTARLLALAEVLVDDSGAWLVISAGAAEAVRGALDRVLFPADDVRLGPLEQGLWLEPLLPGPPELEPGAAVPATWQPLAGGAGWQLGPVAVVPAGAPLPPSMAAGVVLPEPLREWRRLALGVPAIPGEINGDTNPFELGLADRVSLAKGCYVGQETLARLATYDGVKQQLRRWFLPAPGPAPGVGAVLLGEGSERAGVVSSVLALPDGGGWIGLALVRRAALGQGELVWQGEGGEPSPGGALQLSVPAGFRPPPVGAGGQAAA